LPIDSTETIDLGLFPFNGGWLVLVGNGWVISQVIVIGGVGILLGVGWIEAGGGKIGESFFHWEGETIRVI
jgi:hypothetical protein